ncbi:MAG: DUF2809 domain-containing protein [Flavobacteriaceae bacterium]|nr:DUF2809 domain-containing protein [Flavobacteriaceae bacterium]
MKLIIEKHQIKNSLFNFQIKYLIIAVVLFLVEVYIALYVKLPIIRHFFGDVLVVILIYTFVKSFFNFSVKATAIGVLIFSYLIEIFQYFNGIQLLGLQDNYIARLVIGTTFTWSDLIAYLMGVLVVILFEKR